VIPVNPLQDKENSSARKAAMEPEGEYRQVSSSAARAAGAVSILAVLFNSGPAMSEQCPLSSPLVVKDLQDGVIGPTGLVWTIGVDCTINVARQDGPIVGEPFYRGRLSSQEEVELRDVLAKTSPAELPAEIGGGPQVNARRLIVTLGSKVSTLTLAPAADLARARSSSDQSARRLVELAETVMSFHRK
jgi:hypothetical protein